MQNILRERVLDFSLVFTIAATIFQSSAPVVSISIIDAYLLEDNFGY